MKKILISTMLGLFTTTAVAGDFLVVFFKTDSSYSEQYINIKQVAHANWTAPGKDGQAGSINISFTGSQKDVSIQCKDESAIKRIMKALKKGSDETVNASKCL